MSNCGRRIGRQQSSNRVLNTQQQQQTGPYNNDELIAMIREQMRRHHQQQVENQRAEQARYHEPQSPRVESNQEVVVMAQSVPNKPAVKVLRGGNNNGPIVVPVVEQPKESPKPAPKKTAKIKRPESYKAVMALGNAAVDALAKEYGLDLSTNYSYAGRCAAVWAAIGGNQRVVPEKPAPKQEPVAVAKVETAKDASVKAVTPTKVPVDQVSNKLQVNSAANVADTIKAASYKACAGNIGAAIVQLRSLGHTESNGEFGAVILDLERIKERLDEKGKTTPIELQASSVAASRPAAHTAMVDSPVVKPTEEVKYGPGGLCRVCRKVKVGFDTVGMCNPCALQVAGIHDKNVRRLPDSPNVFTPEVTSQDDDDESSDDDTNLADNVADVKMLLAKPTMLNLRRACIIAFGNGHNVNKGDSLAMRNALNQWVSNNEGNDTEENEDDVISDEEREDMHDDTDDDVVTADDADAEYEESESFKKDDRVEVVADDAVNGQGELIGKFGRVRNVSNDGVQTIVNVVIDGEKRPTPFVLGELSKSDKPYRKASSETSIFSATYDLPWCEKKCQIIECLQKCGASSATTAVSINDIAKATGLKKKAVRHYTMYARAGSLVEFAEYAGERVTYVYLTPKGMKTNARKEWRIESERKGSKRS